MPPRKTGKWLTPQMMLTLALAVMPQVGGFFVLRADVEQLKKDYQIVAELKVQLAETRAILERLEKVVDKLDRPSRR